MSIKSKLSVLVQLANIDGEFAGEEKTHIYMIGKANGITEAEIDDLVDNPEEMPPVSTMTEEDKFEYLYNLVQLMKIDNQVFLSEIKFCEEMAVKLGFKRKVVSKFSSRIYSDPSITSNIDALKKEMRRQQL